jgi:hypothetical protein
MRLAATNSIGRTTRRLWIVSPLMALVLGAVWCAGWWGIATATEAQIDAWLDQERALGRAWACSQREINGFPFQIAIRCETAKLVGDVNGQPVEGGVSALRAVAQLYRPNQINAEAVAPFTFRDAGGGNLNLDWASLRATIVGNPTAFGRLALEAEQLTARVSPAVWGETAGKATRAQVDIRPLSDSPIETKAYDLSIRLENIVIASLDAYAGSDLPANIALSGTLSQAEFAGKGTATERLERWRQAGGKFDIAALALSKGSMHILAHGQLQLDELHRPSGHLDADLDGVEPLMIRLGLPVTAVRLGNLGSLLAGGNVGSKGASGPGEKIRLKLTFDKGRLMVGPFPILQLRPLY